MTWSATLSPQDELQAVPGSTVPVLFSPGALRFLGREAQRLGGTRALLVSDEGLVRAGHVRRAEEALRRAGVDVTLFTGVKENPTTEHVAAGLAAAREGRVDIIVGLGGGSSMDCAKGVNFLLTNGGRMQDYWGVGKATRPMLPLIAVPTTTGTGSEAQSAALITDPETHQKMACLDPKALARLAILDVELALTEPASVAAVTGIDALSHAVETAASTKRTAVSRRLSAAAWRLLRVSYERMLHNASDVEARTGMLLGAHLAGAAIENAMLGAAHACANPLTAKYGLVHGAAVGVMLPSVIRFNAQTENYYADLDTDSVQLASYVASVLGAAKLPATLKVAGIPKQDLPELAAMASTQWTARFNPRPVDAPQLIAIYELAYH